MARARITAWVKSLIGSLSVGLFAWLFAVILAAFAAFAFVNVRYHADNWSQSVHNSAQRLSDLIKSSTHYGMLLNRKQDVHNIIETIARDPEVLGVRIYDKQGRIMFSADGAEIGRQVDLQAEACVACHRGAAPLASVPEGSRMRLYKDASERRVLGLISPIENAPECASASCHAHDPGQRVLGVLDVKMSMAQADARLATAERQVIAAAILTALAVGVTSALFIYWMVRRPVKRLLVETRRIAGGDLSGGTNLNGRSEIGDLARSFDKMKQDLSQARAELTSWSDRLESRLVEKTEELGRTQGQVLHMEKMASLGKLAATVAHELNNPLAGILAYARLVERTVQEGGLAADTSADTLRQLGLIAKEAARCGDIVRNLLVFARSGGGEFALHRLRPIVERALMLVRHHIEIAQVRLETLLPEPGSDELVCDADQIQQALVALLVNAVEAMGVGGTLRVEAAAEPASLRLTVADSGQGIPAELIDHVFEPFFTTKEKSGSVGLGLSVVYGIVQRHGGEIDVDSEVGRGTTIRVVLPRRQAERGATRAEAEVQHVH